MAYTIPIRIEKRDEATEKWVVYMPTIHSKINKNTKGVGNEALSAGAIQIRRSLLFEVRYSPEIKEIAHNTQLFRIIYGGQPYNIVDYDDYEERHQNIRLAGTFY